jgi:hypothetical protein
MGPGAGRGSQARTGWRRASLVALPVLVLAGLGPGAAQPTRPADRGLRVVPDTVTVYGRVGSLGALGDRSPSGQGLARAVVPGFGLPAGWQAHVATVAADGSVLVAGRPDARSTGDAAAPGPVVGVFDPATNEHTTLRLAQADERSAVIDLEPVDGGVAVLYGPGRLGPLLGLLTRKAGGWRADPSPVSLTSACPAHGCPTMGDLAAVPGSRDVIVAWPADGATSGSIAVVRLTGPDAAGRLAVAVRARYQYPRIPDPIAPRAEPLRVSPIEVDVDPTGTAGRPRFAVGLDVRAADGRPEPRVVQEFSYDARRRAIEPLSAPLLPGDRVPGLDRQSSETFFAFGASVYDRQGNLWVGRTNGLHGGRLAVYPRLDGRAALARPGCAHAAGRPLGDYVSRAGRRATWGRTCRPDYDILQAAEQFGLEGLAIDPTTGDVVILALGGVVMLVRPSGSGRAMRFRIGNAVDLGLKLLPLRPGAVRREWLAAVTAGRAWMVSSYFEGSPGIDHWIYSVRLGDLLDPPPVPLSDTPGRMVTVQAEQTLTTSTSQRSGLSARTVVDSDAYVAWCSTWISSSDCGHDTLPGDGMFVRDDTGYGHLAGDLTYRIRVPTGGRYRPAYRVGTFPNMTHARIEFEVAGQTITTRIPPLGNWSTIYERSTVDLPAGVHLVRLAPPTGDGGWALNWFGLERL